MLIEYPKERKISTENEGSSSSWEWELQCGFADPKRPPPVLDFWNCHWCETMPYSCWWRNAKFSAGRWNVGIREWTTNIIVIKSPCKESQPRDKGPGWNTWYFSLFLDFKLITLWGFFEFLSSSIQLKLRKIPPLVLAVFSHQIFLLFYHLLVTSDVFCGVL